MQAALLAAGLDGIQGRRDPGKRLDINMYTEGHLVSDVKHLPLNLLNALRALQDSKLLNESLGEYVTAYIKLKYQEWINFSPYLSDYNPSTTLTTIHCHPYLPSKLLIAPHY